MRGNCLLQGAPWCCGCCCLFYFLSLWLLLRFCVIVRFACVACSFVHFLCCKSRVSFFFSIVLTWHCSKESAIVHPSWYPTDFNLPHTIFIYIASPPWIHCSSYSSSGCGAISPNSGQELSSKILSVLLLQSSGSVLEYSFLVMKSCRIITVCFQALWDGHISSCGQFPSGPKW